MAVLSTSSPWCPHLCYFGRARAGVPQQAPPAEQHQTPVQRPPATQQRNRTPGAIAALTPLLGSKPAQQPAVLPDSPEALPVTVRTPGSGTPGSGTPATQPAENILAAEGASPEATVTQTDAQEEPTMIAKRPQQLLLVFDGRPHVLRAEGVIGLAMPDTLAGDHTIRAIERAAQSNEYDS